MIAAILGVAAVLVLYAAAGYLTFIGHIIYIAKCNLNPKQQYMEDVDEETGRRFHKIVDVLKDEEDMSFVIGLWPFVVLTGVMMLYSKMADETKVFVTRVCKETKVWVNNRREIRGKDPVHRRISNRVISRIEPDNDKGETK